MKRVILVIVMGVILSLNAMAQSTFTLNTRAWSTNYFTTILYDVAHDAIGNFIISDPANALTYNRIVPTGEPVFPILFQKAGFEANDIFSPYHRAFKNPFTKPGDFGIGLDASWNPNSIGLYAGAYFKSQEICFKANDDNLRSFYFQPRAGIILGKKDSLEAGIYYDMVVGSVGRYPGVEKAMFSNGLGLDFAFSRSTTKNRESQISFMLPLHNFLNEDYPGFNGMKHRVGYIMLTERIGLDSNNGYHKLGTLASLLH